MNICDNEYQKMIKTPIKKLIICLSLPTTISMIITSVYNIVDTFFVRSLGKEVSGAISVVFPLMALLQAIGFMLGTGSGSLISLCLGKKEDEKAKNYGLTAFILSALLGLIFMFLSLLFLTPILKLLGSTEKVLPYAFIYARYTLFGAPIMTASFALNNILRSEGKAKLAMIGLVFGALLNIVLDPILIFILNLGIKGAAIATLISQIVSFFLLLLCFIRKKTIIKLKIKNFSFKKNITFDILKIGFPSFIRQLLAALAAILLNNQASLYGSEAGLSAMGIVNKIFMIVFSICIGIGQGYQPVVGFNYSAKEYKRVKGAMIFTYLYSLVILSIIALFLYFNSTFFIKLFITDNEVIMIGTKALKYYALSIPLINLNIICNMTYQAINKKIKAVILSVYRQGIFFLPLVFLLPKYYKMTGVEITQALADGISFIFSIPFFILLIIRFNKRHKESLN